MRPTPELPLRIAQFKNPSPYNHHWGGTSWKSTTDPLDRALIAVLDLAEQPLSTIQTHLPELPLLSHLYGVPDIERYRLPTDPSARRVDFFEPPRVPDDPVPDGRVPRPFPARPFGLRQPTKQEASLDLDTATETFVDQGFFRIGGAPLWYHRLDTPPCSCGRPAPLLASLSYEFDKSLELTTGGTFFLGELWLFFFFCEVCQVMTVVSDG